MTLLDRGPGFRPLDADAFLRLAEHLDRLGDEGLRRSAERRVALHQAVEAGRALVPQSWSGPHATGFRADVDGFASEVVGGEEPTATAWRALKSLADTARRTGAVIREVEWREKSWNQQFVANWSEWQDRSITALSARLGLTEDAVSEKLQQRYDEESRFNAEASAQREGAMRAWHEQCGHVAQALRSAHDKLGAVALVPRPAMEQRERSYHVEAAKAQVQSAWLERIERLAEAASSDPAKIKALWEAMDEVERDKVMERRPDLAVIHLWGAMSPEELADFKAGDKFSSRSSTTTVSAEVTIPLPPTPAQVVLAAQFSARKAVDSDGSVEATLSLTTEGAVALGLAKYVSARIGDEERVSLIYRFGSEAEFDAAVATIRAALGHDLGAKDTSLASTVRAFDQVLGTTKYGNEWARGVKANIDAEFGLGPAFLAGESAAVGVYVNEIDAKVGIFAKGSIKVIADGLVAQATGEVSFEAKLSVAAGGRRYFEISLGGDASASASAELLRRSGVPASVVESLHAGAYRGATAAWKFEVTDANRERVESFLRDLGQGRLSPDKLRDLTADADVTAATMSGVQETNRVPYNPLLKAEESTRESTTVHSYRKPPGGSYYEQGVR